MEKLDRLALALTVLKKCDFRYGKYVLITGCCETALLAAKLAKSSGAADIVFAVSDVDEKARAEAQGFAAWVNGADEYDALIARTEGRKFDIVIEVSGTAASYELLMRAAKRGAFAALLKALAEPLNCHICDAIRDQIHFIGIRTPDADCVEKAKRVAAAV